MQTDVRVYFWLCDTDDNECEYENGGCVHYCHNTYGNYSCSCLTGFQLHRDAHDCIGLYAFVSLSLSVYISVCLCLSIFLCLCELGLVSESLSRQSVCLLARILRPIIWSPASVAAEDCVQYRYRCVDTYQRRRYTACLCALPVCLPMGLWASGLSSVAVCISWTYTNLPTVHVQTSVLL